MAPRKNVPSLQDLCVTTFQSTVINMIRDQALLDWTDVIKTLKMLFESYIPQCYHKRVSETCLLGLKALYSDSNFVVGSNKEEVANLLFCVFSNLKHVVINVDDWCSLIQHKLIQQRDKLRNVEVFSCNTKSGDVEIFLHPVFKIEDVRRRFLLKELLLRHPFWYHLSTFTLWGECTDKILSVVCQNCPFMRKLDVRASSDVTDGCIPFLRRHQHLQYVNVTYTRITFRGLAEFLAGSMSKNLVDVKCFESDPEYQYRTFELMLVFSQLSHEVQVAEGIIIPFPSHQIKFFKLLDMNTQDLEFLGLFFTNISELTLGFMDKEPDWTCVPEHLPNLNRLHVNIYDISSERFLNSILVTGSFITTLNLRVITHVGLDEVMRVIPSSCPNIENLKFIQDSHLGGAFFPSSVQFLTRPFQKLTSFIWLHYDKLSYAQFILSHAYKIKEINITPSFDTLPSYDAFLRYVLDRNPLQQLRTLKLMGTDPEILSVETLKFLLSNCQNISYIQCGLWEQNNKTIQDFIKKNNYDVQFSPKV